MLWTVIGIGPGIDDLDRALPQRGASDHGLFSRPDRGGALDALEFRIEQIAGGIMVGAVAISPQDRRFRARELRNSPHQCLQHRLEVEIGAADRAQHLGGRGLQLLRVAQLGDVADRADHPPDAAGPVAQRDTVLVRPAPFAVARPIAVLAIETRLLAAEQGSPGPAIGRQVVGIDAARPILDRAQPLVSETEHRAQLRRVIDRSVGRVVVVNRLVDRFERERVALGAGRRQGRVIHVRRNPFGS